MKRVTLFLTSLALLLSPTNLIGGQERSDDSMAAKPSAAPASDVSKSPARTLPFRAQLLLIKSDWSQGDNAKEIEADWREALKDLPLSQELLDKLPASGPEILFAPDLVKFYRIEHFQQLYRWLTQRGLVEEWVLVPDPEPVLPPALRNKTRGKEVGVPVDEYAATVSKRMDFIPLPPPLRRPGTASGSGRIYWDIVLSKESGRLAIVRKPVVIERKTEQGTASSAYDCLCSVARYALPKGYAALTHAFPASAEGELREAARRAGIEPLIVVFELSPREYSRGSGKKLPPRESRFCLPDSVETVSVQHGHEANLLGPRMYPGRVPPGLTRDPNPPSSATFSERMPGTKKYRVFRLKNADADSVATTLTQLFREDITIDVGGRNKWLLVRGEEPHITEAAKLIERIDVREDTGADDGRVPARKTEDAVDRGLQWLRAPDAYRASQPNAPADIDKLREHYRSAERAASETAAELLRLQEASDGSNAGTGLAALRLQLRGQVAGSFALRQQLHEAELANLLRKLKQAHETISQRNHIKDQIIDRRVEDLLNPNLPWEPMDTEKGEPQAPVVIYRDPKPGAPALAKKPSGRGVPYLSIAMVTLATGDPIEEIEVTGLIVSPDGHILLPLPQKDIRDDAVATLMSEDKVRANHVTTDEWSGLCLFRLNRDDVPVSKFPDGFYYADLERCAINESDEAVVQAVYFDEEHSLSFAPMGHAFLAWDDKGKPTGRIEGEVPLDHPQLGTLLNSRNGFMGMVVKINTRASHREEVWKRYAIEAVPASAMRDFVRRLPTFVAGSEPQKNVATERSTPHTGLPGASKAVPVPSGADARKPSDPGSEHVGESTFTQHPRAMTVRNLARLMLAMHEYCDVHKHFPPATILGKDGKGEVPHSWRVELLPFLGHQELYDLYHFDEPWDSEHNKTLLAKMPDVFRSPLDAPDATNACYLGIIAKDVKPLIGGLKTKDAAAPHGRSYERLVVPKGMCFLWPSHGVRLSDIIDGTKHTIALVEAKRGIPWTKPEDITYDAKKPLPEFGGWFEGGFFAGFGDGMVKFILADNDERTIRNLLTVNDGRRFEPKVIGAIPRDDPLEFRILPNHVETGREPYLSDDEFERSRKQLAKGDLARPAHGDGYCWREIESSIRDIPFTLKQDDRSYVLTSFLDNTLLWSELQGHFRVAGSKMELPEGTSSLDIEFDDEVGAKLRRLTRANLNNRLAIVVCGKVIMAPTIRDEIGSSVKITGVFSKDELTGVLKSLQEAAETDDEDDVPVRSKPEPDPDALEQSRD